MADLRQDLAFVLVNLSPLQLAECPTGERFLPMLTDCHDLDIHDASVDAVMFSSALCQMDTKQALSEAFRVLKDGGVLLINDMVRDGGEADLLESAIAARVLPIGELLACVLGVGFVVQDVIHPHHDASHFKAMLEEQGIGHLLDGIHPVIIRAVKEAL
jgi:ubiquinone/menaquinone biosynthesis C-methylase UbiE